MNFIKIHKFFIKQPQTIYRCVDTGCLVFHTMNILSFSFIPSSWIHDSIGIIIVQMQIIIMCMSFYHFMKVTTYFMDKNLSVNLFHTCIYVCESISDICYCYTVKEFVLFPSIAYVQLHKGMHMWHRGLMYLLLYCICHYVVVKIHPW